MKTLKKNTILPKCEYCGREYLSYYNGTEFFPACSCEKDKNNASLNKKGLYNDCRIDKYFIDNDFKVHDKKLKPYYEDLDWIDKQSLFIYGNFGCHKTGQVVAICKKVMDNNNSVRYYRTSEIVYQKDCEAIKRVRLLVFDNFGKNIKFEDSRNALFDLIDYRLHNYLSTIIITNELLKDKIDGALYDRLKMFVKIMISGVSSRAEKKG